MLLWKHEEPATLFFSHDPCFDMYIVYLMLLMEHKNNFLGNWQNNFAGTFTRGRWILQTDAASWALGQTDGQQKHQHEKWQRGQHEHGWCRYWWLDVWKAREDGQCLWSCCISHMGLWRATRVLHYASVFSFKVRIFSYEIIIFNSQLQSLIYSIH